MQTTTLPAHIAIIMDGNGRWAADKNKPRFYGHRAGHTAVLRTVTACAKFGIKSLTLFAFSSENWRRPQAEIDALMLLFSQAIRRNRRLFMKHNIRFKVIGDTSVFSAKLQQQIAALEEKTANHQGLTLNIAANYGGKWDMLQAAQKLNQAVTNGQISADSVNEDSLAQFLSFAEQPDVDLLIRTGGEQRISNFILWQAAYAELCFLDTYWPDFNEQSLQDCINIFSQRVRRFGGLNDSDDTDL